MDGETLFYINPAVHCSSQMDSVVLQDYGIQGAAPRGYRGLTRWGRQAPAIPYLGGGSQMLRPVVAPGTTKNRIAR